MMRVKEKEQDDSAQLRGAPEYQLLLSLIILALPVPPFLYHYYCFSHWDFIYFWFGHKILD